MLVHCLAQHKAKLNSLGLEMALLCLNNHLLEYNEILHRQ